MMRGHDRPEGCFSDFALDRRLAGELEEAEREALDRHATVCERCGHRLEELSREREAFAREARPLALAPMSKTCDAQRSRPQAVVTWLFGAGAAVAAAAAVVLLVRGEPDTTRTKGHSAALGFYVSHAGAVRPGAPGERVEPGDALRFVATTRETRYLAVLSVDGAHRVSVYYPEGTSAALIAPGESVALPVSTVLDDTLGDETLYGVFCPHPFDVEPIRQAIAAAPEQPLAAPAECVVDSTRLRKQAPAPP
jgi:anti-sigma factor RsiW